jgi:hypothetical protein
MNIAPKKFNNFPILVKFTRPDYFIVSSYLTSLIIFIFLEKDFHIYLLTTFGLFSILLYGIWKRKKFESTNHWLPTDAKLIKIGVIQTKCHEWETIPWKEKPYRISIIYNYTIEDQIYESTQYAINEPCNYDYTLSEVKEKVKSISDNSKKFTVYVNPRNYKEAIVERGIKKKFTPSLLFMLILYGTLYFFILLIMFR